MSSTTKKRNGLIKLIKALFIVVFSFLLVSKLLPSNKSVFIFNYAPMTIKSSSMEPQYLTNSLIIIYKEPINGIVIGDVIVYKADALNGKLAFHRVTKITNEGILVKGDNNEVEDNQIIVADTYIGKSVFHTNLLAPYLTRIQKPGGFMLFFLLPLLALAIFFYAIDQLFNKKSVNRI